MSKLSLSALGLCLLFAASGCCCGWPCGGHSSFYGGGGCPTGQCGANYPAGAYIAPTTVQATGQPISATSVAAAPLTYVSGYQPLTMLP